MWRCSASCVGGRLLMFFLTLRNAAALSLLISTSRVPLWYNWHTKASASAIVRWVGGLVSLMDVNKLDVWLSNAFQALPFPIPQNWLVVSHPVIAWKTSKEFLVSSGISILWTGMKCFFLEVPENIHTSSQRLCLWAKRRTRTSVSLHMTLTCL